MNKRIARILLILLILAIAALACVGGGGDGAGAGNGSTSAQNGAQITQSANATATYGAEQFHIQLTAVAQPGP